jgi:hypothetical protein
MYVVPVYATREQSDTSSYLTLRYVMVYYGGKAGIGETLVDAISDMAGAPAPNQPGNNGNNGHPQHQTGKGDTAKAQKLLEQAQRDFAAADRAFTKGRFDDYVRLNHQARQEVAKALNLLG